MEGRREPGALAHVEKTLADAYRREIDQEENVWRSLPFFTATLALEVTAIFQVLNRLPPLEHWTGIASLLFLVLSGSFALVALILLAASVKPAEFIYVTMEVALLDYTEGLIRDEQGLRDRSPQDQFSAVTTLKSSLARQYAEATVHNRQINRIRDRSRSIAGLLIIFSVLATLLLVATSLAHHTRDNRLQGAEHGRTQANSERAGTC